MSRRVIQRYTIPAVDMQSLNLQCKPMQRGIRLYFLQHGRRSRTLLQDVVSLTKRMNLLAHSKQSPPIL